MLQVKMMMLKVIARTVGLHRLILLNLYPYFQKYVQVFCHFFPSAFKIFFLVLSEWSCICSCCFQSHQRDVTSLLAAAVQACHDMVCDLISVHLFITMLYSFNQFSFAAANRFSWLGSTWCSWTIVQTNSESVCAWSISLWGDSCFIKSSVFFDDLPQMDMFVLCQADLTFCLSC